MKDTELICLSIFKGKILRHCRSASFIYLAWTVGTLLLSLTFHLINFRFNEWNMLSFTTDGEIIGYSAILLLFGLIALINLSTFLILKSKFVDQPYLTLVLLVLPLFVASWNFYASEYLWLVKIPYMITTSLTYEFIYWQLEHKKHFFQLIAQEVIYFIFAVISFFVIIDMFAPGGICRNCGIEEREQAVIAIFIFLFLVHCFFLFKNRTYNFNK